MTDPSALPPTPKERLAINAAESQSPTGAARRLTYLYIFALSTVALLSLGAQLLIQRQLANGESDSRVVNLAGRQRMLSQRLAKSALRMQAVEGTDATAARQELAETYLVWSKNHRGLQYGDPELGLPGEASPAVAERFAGIEPDFLAMKRAAETLVKGTFERLAETEAIEAINRHESGFLVGMDAIVSQYVTEAELRVARLRRLETAILVTTLLVLLGEGLLVFRPAVRKMATLTRRLLAAKENAEKANAAKTRFLANVSHELRTPMTAVLGMTDLAQETRDDLKRRRFLSIVAEAGQTLLGLLNDLIDIARIDADEVFLANEPFYPDELVGRVERLMRVAAEAKGINLVTTIGSRPLAVSGDARRLEQVLTNLVGNAIKWTDTGTVSLGCESEVVTAEHTQVRFAIEDTGVGISPEEQSRVFESFHQTDASRPRGGVGLGLAICRRIITAMGGDIVLSSVLGSGTRFEVTVELASAEPPVPAALQEADGSSPLPSLKVLVAEDTEVNQLLIREILTGWGHRTRVVGDGESAVAAFRETPFDLLLIDLRLPGIDGLTAARRIVEVTSENATRKPAIVCITADAGPARPAADGDPFDEVVMKPIRREDLLRALRRCGESVADVTIPNDLRKALAEAFSVTAPEQCRQLADALTREDQEAAQLITHRFRGQVAYFDAEGLLARLEALESSIRAGCFDLAHEQGADVIDGVNLLVEDLLSTRGCPDATL